MINTRDTYINIDIMDVIEDLKKEAASRGLDVFTSIRPQPKNILVTCPNVDAHGGIERTPSCFIHREYGMVHCFGCGYKRSLSGLIKDILSLQDDDSGFQWLLKQYGILEAGERVRLGLNWERKKEKVFIPEDMLDIYDKIHPYLYRRGLTNKSIDMLRLGYNSINDSITIPVKDYKSRLVFVKERPIIRRNIHYFVPASVDKRDLLYGIDIAFKNRARIDKIWLVEGDFDVAMCLEADIWGLGLQGNWLYSEHRVMLRRLGVRSLVLCLDNDEAGVRGTERCISMLKNDFVLEQAIYLTDDKDPNQLGADKLRSMPLKRI